MSIKKSLAIVIPAYKQEYLVETLESISKQTCKLFTLYIGDDASPFDLYSIVKSFENKIDIKYTRFDKNIGGENLVEQWNRCVDLTHEEKWIWLFSDDDIMDDTCVEYFYKAQIQNTNIDVFHFNTILINNMGEIIRQNSPFPSFINIFDFCIKKIFKKDGLVSYIPDFIIRKSVFIANGKFEYFDMAWGSDAASIMKFACNNGIVSIQDCFVFWRFSGINISSKKNNLDIQHRLYMAELQFRFWALDFIKNKKIVKLNAYKEVYWIIGNLKNIKQLSLHSRIRILKNRYIKRVDLFYFAFILLIFGIIYERLKN